MPSIFPRYAARVTSENVGDEPEAAYVWFAVFTAAPVVSVGWPTITGTTHTITTLGPLGIPVSKTSNK